MEDESRSLEHTPTWVVAVVCSVIILISLCAERGLHSLGKRLERKQQALVEALQKLKEELMLLGFISLLLTVFQGLISHMCIPPHLASIMLPCKMEIIKHGRHSQQIIKNGRRLMSAETGSENHCLRKGKVPLLSLEALHQLHIFIFVLAVTHVIFCVTTMLLGGAKIRHWKNWEDSIRRNADSHDAADIRRHHRLFKLRAGNYWRKAAVISWVVSFFKQFHGSVKKSDYIALRSGFIRAHCPSNPGYDFHNYMLRTLEHDFKKIFGISWYLWLFVVIFLLLNIEGWHTYFWLSFLPLVLLLLVGAKLEHIITRLAEESSHRGTGDPEATPARPSDDYFWLHRPIIVLYLIHFILFQNSFEIAFFFWIWSTYGFRSCIMEKLGYIIPRLLMGVLVQVLCSYSTLPLYALVTQMGSMFRPSIFSDYQRDLISDWAQGIRGSSSDINTDHMNRMAKESFESIHVTEQRMVVDEGSMRSTIELTNPSQTHNSSS